MNKREFLAGLQMGLSGLPQEDIDERLAFYNEMLDDRIEEGLSEEEAVAAVGSVDEIVRQAVADIPFAKIAKERIRPKRRLRAWEGVLLALGSPIWLSLGIAAVAAILAIYVSLWAVIISLWAVLGALAVCAVVSVPECVILAAGGNIALGLAILAAGMICAGFSIVMFCGCRKTTTSILTLTKRITMWMKKCFIKKEEVS